MQLGDFVDGDYAMWHAADAANDEYEFERGAA